MKSNYSLLYIFLLSISLISCKEDPEPWFSRGNNGWEYYNGDGDIKNYHNVVVDFDIDNNLNVDGIATITNDLTIGNDLNLHKGGKTIIKTYHQYDTVYINGNINLDDSLLIFKGVVIANRDLNVHETGVVNVTDSATFIIRGNLNNSGHIYGHSAGEDDNIIVEGKEHSHDKSITSAASLDLNR